MYADIFMEARMPVYRLRAVQSKEAAVAESDLSSAHSCVKAVAEVFG